VSDPRGRVSEPVIGWCANEVEQELPGLRVLSSELSVGGIVPLLGPSPRAILEQLALLSNRWGGARAVVLRQKPIAAAYRVFFRHIGLDPDVTRTPVEAAVLERMLRGGFLSTALLEDVLLIALIDTGVPIWALDADTLDGPLGLRLSHEGEPLGGSAEGSSLLGGQLVVADASSVLAVLFGDIAPAYRVSAQTRRVALFSVQVVGVPTLYVEEALWMCITALDQFSPQE
jgi:DNA/RNA-binding domain of Phe-tRNA-synthetase-like protein